MRIQYMSDLHLEFQDNRRLVRDYDIPVTGEGSPAKFRV